MHQQLGKNGGDAVLGAYIWSAASKLLSYVYKNVPSGKRSSVEPRPYGAQRRSMLLPAATEVVA